MTIEMASVNLIGVARPDERVLLSPSWSPA